MTDELKPRKVLALPPEMRKRLETLNDLIEESENAIISLEKMGMDASTIKAEIGKAKEQRKVLLEDFD